MPLPVIWLPPSLNDPALTVRLRLTVMGPVAVLAPALANLRSW